MWIRKLNERGVWFYDGEIEIGLGAALRGMATVLVDDPVFGLYAYGGSIEKLPDGIRVRPRDGLNIRFFNLTDRYMPHGQRGTEGQPVECWDLRSLT